MKRRPLFVYGTLKRGFGNHNSYLAECTFLGEAVTLDHFDMIDVGFPALLPQQSEKGYQALGEVYEIGPAQAVRIDQLEGNGRMYLREPRAVQMLESKDIITVDIYIGLPGIWSEVQDVRPTFSDRYLNGLVECFDWQGGAAWRKRGVSFR